MRFALSSRLILTFVGITLPVAAHAEDLNETHIFNPRWPPHAKFHDGQTLSLSLLLGGLTVLLSWKSTRRPTATLTAAAGIASLYFVSQSTAILYPGTDYFDPEVKPRVLLGIPAPVVIDTVYLGAICAAYLLGRSSERRRTLPD